MNSGTMKLKVNGLTAELIMNRPEVLNAADPVWVEDLHGVLDELEAAKNLRAVVLAGEGRSFSTGIDLRSLAQGAIKIDWFRRWEEALRRLENLEPLTIARIHGYALGGGLQVALACDLRIASLNARLGLPAVLEALIPGLGTYRLPRFIGLGRAKRMIVTGEVIDAKQALEIGLVDWVVADAELDQMTEQVIKGLMNGFKTAQSLSKRLATAAFEMDFDSFCETYYRFQSQSLASSEHRGAMEEYLKSKNSSGE